VFLLHPHQRKDWKLEAWSLMFYWRERGAGEMAYVDLEMETMAGGMKRVVLEKLVE
jgi:hypothetical protein